VKTDEATRALPVLVVTQMDESRRALALGADAYARKPIERQWLLGQLRALGDPAGMRRALIIDDDEVVRYLMKGLFRDTPFVVSEACDDPPASRWPGRSGPASSSATCACPGCRAWRWSTRWRLTRPRGHRSSSTARVCRAGRPAPGLTVMSESLAHHDAATALRRARAVGCRAMTPVADRLRILNADDYGPARYARTKLLQQAGFSGGSPDRRQTLRQAIAAGPHVVLLDVKLPDLDGYEVCRRQANPITASPCCTSVRPPQTGDRPRLDAGAKGFS
jgi:CheY-like chemotaxis protein